MKACDPPSGDDGGMTDLDIAELYDYDETAQEFVELAASVAAEDSYD